MRSMNIIVFGASGATGRELVSQAQRQGHSVTAFIRDRSTYSAAPGVQIALGDVRAINSVEDAVAGHVAVVVALGPRTIGKSDLLARGSANIVAAMGKQGVRRIVALGAAGAMPGAAKKQGFAGRILLGALAGSLLRNVMNDQRELEKHIGESELDFTIVRPARLTNGVATGAYRVDAEALPVRWRPMSRSDVAAFMLKQLNDKTHIRRAVYVSM